MTTPTSTRAFEKGANPNQVSRVAWAFDVILMNYWYMGDARFCG